MSERIYNFSAGPAVLPEPVLRKAQEAIWDVAGSGIGIMEHSHRGKVFDRILDEAEQACRDLAGIPDNYQVLFLQGGASLQFAMVPMNLLPADRTADYLLTGVWAQKAVKEAKSWAARCTSRPRSESHQLRPDSAGRRRSSTPSGRPTFTSPPTTPSTGPSGGSSPRCRSGVPLVADTSSDMYSRPIDVSSYGLIYAGAQKNLGPSGVVLVIIRDDLVEAGPKTLPTMLQYRTHAAEKSLYNTPPTFGIYVMGEVFKWIQAQGGLEAMAEHNESKARLLYDYRRPERLLPRHRAAGQSLADERLLPRADRGAGEQIRGRGDEARARRAQGTPERGRDASQHLQRVPPRGSGGAGCVHEGVRAGQSRRRARLTAR